MSPTNRPARRLVRAGWVLPVSRPPIADGAVVVDGDRVVDIGTTAAMTDRYPGLVAEDLGMDAMVVPGLVDAHCHLEWAAMDGAIGSAPFGRWLAAFMPRRARMEPGDYRLAAQAGAWRALAAGTTCLADSGPTGAGVDALAATGQRGVVHLEAFGTMAGAVAADHAAQHALRLGQLGEPPPGVTVGLSPHAPYSVGPELWQALGDNARLTSLPWATHIAESPDEQQLAATGDGPLAELFAGMGFAPGAWPAAQPDEGASTICQRLEAHGALRPGLIAAHCVQLGADDPRLLAQRGVRVAHCPRSNVHLRCGTAPLGALRRAGVTVALGTDSPASGGDYDLRAEARACRDLHGDAAPSDTILLRMITLGGAEAMGCQREAGHLEPGARADWVVLRCPRPPARPDDAATVALAAQTVVDQVVIGGRCRIGADGVDVAVRQIWTDCDALAARLR